MPENELAKSDLSREVKPGAPHDAPEESFEIDVPDKPEELAPPPYPVEAREAGLQVEPVATSAPEPPPPAPEPAAAEEPSRRRRRAGSGAWLGGLVMIAMGLIFLYQNTTGRAFANWWALFILIPAFSALSGAWRAYRAGGFGPRVSGGLVGGAMMLLVAIIFLFNLNWGRVWPLFLIVIGGGALLGGFSRDDDD